MSAVLWMNIPLMVLAFGLIAGIPLWMVLRRADWHAKPEARSCRLTWSVPPARSARLRCAFPGTPATKAAAPCGR